MPHCQIIPPPHDSSHLSLPRRFRSPHRVGAGLGSGLGPGLVGLEFRNHHLQARTRPRTRYNHETVQGGPRLPKHSSATWTTYTRSDGIRSQTRWVPASDMLPKEPTVHRPRRGSGGCSPGGGWAARGAGPLEKRSAARRRPASVSPHSPGVPGPRPPGPQGPAFHQDRLVLLRDPALLLTAEQVTHGGRPGPCPAALPGRTRAPRHTATVVPAQPTPLRRPRGAWRRRTRNAAVCGQKPRPAAGWTCRWRPGALDCAVQAFP